MPVRTKLASLLMALALIGSSFSITGCKTPEGTQFAVTFFRIAAKDAVFFGTTAYLKAHPEDRPKFLLARTSLRALIAAGQFNAEQLTAALHDLPISTFQGEESALVISDIVEVIDQLGRVTTLDDSQAFATWIFPISKSILSGLDLALGP